MGSAAGFTLQSDIVADYLVHYGSEEQKKRYLPGMVAGTTISAIAMTEPGAGSDLQGMKTIARPDGNGWKLSGSKTYITNGQAADLVIVGSFVPQGVQVYQLGAARGRRADGVLRHRHARDPREAPTRRF